MYFGAVTVAPTTWSASTAADDRARSPDSAVFVSVLAVMGGSRSAAAAGVAAANEKPAVNAMAIVVNTLSNLRVRILESPHMGRRRRPCI